MPEEMFWADQIARSVIKWRGEKEKYTVAAGITPSGTVHIGNFREIITVDLIARALRSLGKKVRYIYSWDDYDRLRKIPKNMPKPEVLKQFLGQPVVDTPDTAGCHKNYAEHLERELEESLPPTGIKPEFIYQHKMYRACKYADDIKRCMLAREKIRKVLNKFRKKEDPLPETWYPLSVFCEKCKKDEGRVTEYDGEYTIKYECTCGYKGEVNFKEKGIVKMPWRVDWPMRWHYEGVDCEGGGKEHNAPGGSLDTGHEVFKAVYGGKPPVRFMYDFVIIKGQGGKMSSSLGNVLSLEDCLGIYLPEVIRFLFAGTKPVKEFAIPTDEEVLKVYEDFFKVERIFYGKEESSRAAHWKRVYEMSVPGEPAGKMPIQPSFKHCVELINIYLEPDEALKSTGEKLSKEDEGRYLNMLRRAKIWVEKYAPEGYKFEINEETPDVKLSKAQRAALKELGETLPTMETEEEFTIVFRDLMKKHKLESREFFKGAYLVLIGKETGPRLAPFIRAIGQKRAAKLFKGL